MTRLETWLPTPDVSAIYAIDIRASPARVFQTLKATDFGANRLVATLMALRAIPALLASPRATWTRIWHPSKRSDCGPVTNLLGGAFALLEEVPDEEIVLGITGRFWTPTGTLTATDAAHFHDPLPRGMARAAWNFHCRALTADTTRLSTETRVHCADKATRGSFLLYWRLIAPGSGLIRRAILRQVRREALRRR